MPVVRSMLLETIILLKDEACGLDSFLKDFFLWGPSFQGVPSWRELDGSEPFLCPLGSRYFSLDRVSFHTFLVESIDLLLSTVRNLHCLFFLCR